MEEETLAEIKNSKIILSKIKNMILKKDDENYNLYIWLVFNFQQQKNLFGKCIITPLKDESFRRHQNLLQGEITLGQILLTSQHNFILQQPSSPKNQRINKRNKKSTFDKAKCLFLYAYSI